LWEAALPSHGKRSSLSTLSHTLDLRKVIGSIFVRLYEKPGENPDLKNQDAHFLR
jgi:hypothetical protein